jgi:hypothetical protein
MLCICNDNGADWQCILPPDSPAWVGSYMEALGWPKAEKKGENLFVLCVPNDGDYLCEGATPLEALRAAWEARG